MTSGVVAIVLGLTAVLSAGPLAQATESSAKSADRASAEVVRAERAMDALQAALLTRLGEALQGGAARAVTVCRDEAAAIAARVAREQGLALGRTSHRLRNPSNVPPAWARSIVARGAGTTAAEQRLQVVDLGDRVGVLRPIGFVDMCATCHGTPARIPDEVREVIAAAYPHDAATGFSPGDLRGWMWAEVPKAPPR